MAKVRTIYICRSCGGAQSRWLGKCPDCGAWDSLESQTVDPGAHKDSHRGALIALAAQSPTEADGIHAASPENPARPLADVASGDAPLRRLSSGISELDRVLGGTGLEGSPERAGRGNEGHNGGTVGLVPGSAVLIGGEPGIGKSTLLLQAAGAWAASGHRTLYVSSEESAEQVKLRATRLGAGVESEAARTNLYLLAETNLARILEQARRIAPSVIVIDSVQMIYRGDLPASPGSVAQLRRCSGDLIAMAKLSGAATVLVGHVTKDGQLAGPRLLEHLVDCVLSFEGDRHHAHRVVRAIKNRFGTTLEIGLFEMTGAGLREAPEGAGMAITSDEECQTRPGSVVCPVMTGTRCVLVEVQALTATGFLGAAKRKSSGLDANRLAMLIAVLEQHAGMRLADRDVFASAVGGIRVTEPASDLPLLLAIAGSQFRRALPARAVALGEVGLGGEVRPVANIEHRLRQAQRLGYQVAIAPRGGRAAIERALGTQQPRGFEVIEVRTINNAMEHLA